jgi:hypothetical protein
LRVPPEDVPPGPDPGLGWRLPPPRELAGESTPESLSMLLSLADPPRVQGPGGDTETGGDTENGLGRGRQRGLWRALAARRWPLLAILAIQAALSLWLIRSNTAFQDEGLYLWSGHLELAHLLHHTQIPAFATYFSGSPVIYPPIGAIADSIGGLAAARILSLVFMLAATTLLHGTTRRLFASRASGFFAAGLFAGVGSAQFLGAFATYDAMALMLLALATWLGVRAAFCRLPARITMVAAGAMALALANATKYASALFDPVVLAVAVLAVWRLRGRVAGLATGVPMAAITTALLAGAYHAGGSAYAQGIKFSTLSRATSTEPALSILSMSARWTGITAALAVIGALIITCTWRDRATTALVWILAAAEFLAPLEQARIHTDVSLFKHVGYGAWFASTIGGYVLASIPRATGPAGGVRALRAGSFGLVLVAVLGLFVGSAQYRSWPDSRALTRALGALERPSGRYLVEDYDVTAYYLGASVQWAQWANTWTFGYTDPATGRQLQNGSAYADAIRHRYFTVIVLNFGDTYTEDQIITKDINRFGGYRLSDIIPYRTDAGSSAYRIWTLIPLKAHSPVRSRHSHHA